MLSFFTDRPLPFRIMIIALILLAVSQFFPYADQAPWLQFGDPNDPFSSVLRPGMGWSQHPQDYALLPLLAFVFLHDDIPGTTWFASFGWIAGLIVFLICVLPAEPLTHAGAAIGVLAFLLALVAGIVHYSQRGKSNSEG